ncbi:16S rRNA (guanine(966)-N(2))-methyltransferase RsmD [Alicyclobacillus dauci]|uniref:16S rRNA (Guanine(966)-N(2))-methyltransferase RsmD n=1 Tax=Alicyclobacillus dauci TaxID=1475485 RepID=A0ABY6YZC9_9BACL|nr:16S rRNA (guanine(966)-N(2))-methyltransferase RsmD [Alicyclobacillus dauci]WAH35481.1 16S rRNA (guanine(966)-N(2))-methyltransferase RsmD [Alicyclobacillus dauci]
MRVIAGKWKSHMLKAPKGSDTRPTTDRVKESMFNLLPHQLEGVVVDLFAGSGALGIEALSRGAESAVFVDADRRAVSVIRDNLTRLGALEQSRVWSCDWKSAIRRIPSEVGSVTWIFLDPPYRAHLWEPVMQSLSDFPLTGGVLCEMPKDVSLPDEINGLVQVKYKVYGDIAVGIYTKESQKVHR